ncbi:hypothetical protein ACOSQ4_009650 [Xanthoceras sorbifolium]
MNTNAAVKKSSNYIRLGWRSEIERPSPFLSFAVRFRLSLTSPPPFRQRRCRRRFPRPSVSGVFLSFRTVSFASRAISLAGHRSNFVVVSVLHLLRAPFPSPPSLVAVLPRPPFLTIVFSLPRCCFPLHSLPRRRFASFSLADRNLRKDSTERI